MKTYRPQEESAASLPAGPRENLDCPNTTTNGTPSQACPDAEDNAPLSPFPLHLLPPVLADMGAAICRTERTPESLAGSCLLGCLSAAIGAGLQVRSGPDRLTRGNLYVMASGESASGKSETFRHTAQPLRDFEDALIESWRQETWPRVLAEKNLLESEIKAANKRKFAGPVERAEVLAALEKKQGALLQIETALHPPSLTIEDITSQTLAERLAARGECLASITADGGEVINNLLGQYNKLDRTDDGLYVKAWSGDRFQRDRMGKQPVTLKRPCLSALWLVQQDKVETLLAERTLTEGGAIPRLLLCHTNCQPRPIAAYAEPIPTAVAHAYRDLIHELLNAFRLAGEPMTIDPVPEALRAMNDHYNSIVARWHAGELRDVGSYALRWTEQAWRIAVCLHAGKHGKEAGNRTLALDTAQAALELADWFAGQQLDILAAGREARRAAQRGQVLSLLASKPASITARDVHRARITATAEEAHHLLADMEKRGELAGRDVATGGRPSRIYTKAL